MADKAQLTSVRNSILRLEKEMKSKRDKITDTRKRFKAEKSNLAKKRMQDRQIHSMENDVFNMKMRWYDLKLKFQQLNKK